MKCKNCFTELKDESEYCPSCGAKIIRTRITFGLLYRDFFSNFMGWDNKFLQTLINLIIKPHVVISEYLDGVRKKYVAPFVFVAFGTALAMILFNIYSEEYIEASSSINDMQLEMMAELYKSNPDLKGDYEANLDNLKKDTIETQTSFLKYFNIFTFLFLPVYAFVSFLVFGWKKINFGEHLVINCYLQGISFFFTLIFFSLSLLISPKILSFSIFITIFYYLFAYGKLLKLSLFNIILKFFKFILVLLGIGIIMVILGLIFGILYAILFKT